VIGAEKAANSGINRSAWPVVPAGGMEWDLHE
jgi:hypothetical protein